MEAGRSFKKSSEPRKQSDEPRYEEAQETAYLPRESGSEDSHQLAWPLLISGWRTGDATGAEAIRSNWIVSRFNKAERRCFTR